MTGTVLVVTARIRKELKNLDMLRKEIVEMLERGGAENDSERKRAFSSLLHDFYTCVERMFQTVAKGLDEYVPDGDNWHKLLLEQMTLSLEERRPAVISEKLGAKLMEYLAFRHLVRNIYGFQLEWAKMDYLAKDLPEVVDWIRDEADSFVKIIEDITKGQIN
ncbi:hypothetical protein [Phosphitispora fastidiosa]|uniref:ribonuclease toxin HepT-like protein n=1 Tax=Phosphitispora fastidiosa TaxID=2837202 RepID=UPI001E6489BD|nr:hypothetical protein [Phosphitispora fastidiosa]MBU7006723.1 hypothetical protein [Phosphitispora fastidiosa]